MPNTRDESFVPLTSGPPAASRLADLRVAILPQAGNAQPFRPLAQSPSGHPHAAAPGPGSEPCISVRRDGDRVSSIEVQCTCGRIIELACVYEPPAVKPGVTTLP